MILLINVLIICLVLGLIWWAVSLLPLPPPFHMVVQVVLIIVLILYLLSLLTGTGYPLLR